MKQSTTQWAREAINNIQSNLIKRASEGTLSNSDQQMMAAMMADIQKELESQTGVNEAIQALYDNLGNIQKELSIPIDSEGAARIERTASEAERNLNELEKVEHIANALQLDAQSIIPLLEQLQQKQNEMRQSFQKAVDIDFQLYGKTSSLTERALEKPSAGKDIARILGVTKSYSGYMENDKYIVTWAIGHLVTLKDPEDQDSRYSKWSVEDLPLPPPNGLKVMESVKSQFRIIKKLIQRDDIQYLINAGDVG